MIFSKSKTIDLFLRLSQKLPKQRKLSLLYLMPLAFLTGLTDVIVVGLVSRLFSFVVGEPNKPPIPFGYLLPEDTTFRIIAIVLIYISTNWIASLFRIILKAEQEKLRVSIWRDLSELSHRNILSQPYEYFINKNNSDLITKVLINISRVCDFIVKPILEFSSGLVIIICICIAVIYIASSAAIYLILSLIVSYLIISLFITPYVRHASYKRIMLEKRTGFILSESIKTIADIHLTGSENYFKHKYSSAWENAFSFIWKAQVLPEIPRSLIEPLGITMIFAIGLFPLLSNNNPEKLINFIPFIATIAVASLKLTPPLQISFKALTKIRSAIPDLIETLKVIELSPIIIPHELDESPTPKGINPRSYISLNKINYQYPNSKKYVLKDISMTIPVGSRIGFVGKTGSGKTTTVNQLLCLLKPTSGSLQIDGIDINDSEIRSWQACCSYVSQSINLLNTNIIENIAYGIEKSKINKELIWEALEAAQLDRFVADLPMGIYTNIGENGIRLSGGQRQRIALAKAFYRKSSFLILDEATSSLDNKTESDVMDSISLINRSCTIIIIAHRLSTVERCDYIYEFDNGSIKESGTFKELLTKSDSFKKMVLAGKEIIADMPLNYNE